MEEEDAVRGERTEIQEHILAVRIYTVIGSSWLRF